MAIVPYLNYWEVFQILGPKQNKLWIPSFGFRKGS